MVGRAAVAGLMCLLFGAHALALPTAEDAGLVTRAAGKRAVGYFVNWAVYGRNYQPQDLPASKLTHVLYGFANVNSTGGVYLSDEYADLQKHYPTDSWNDVGNNVYGCIKQLFLLKKANRNLKTMLSIGGWTYSPNFHAPLGTAAGRQQFVDSAITLLKDLGLDGLDIDYEYPASAQEAADFVTLLKQLRQGLDAYSSRVGLPAGSFLISVASPAGPTNYEVMDMAGMDASLDFWNLMAYDYAGSFSNLTGHDANWAASGSNPGSTPFNSQQALDYYKAHGVSPAKTNLGIPLYGRSFTGTTGMGQTFSGVGQGSWEAGIYDWKALPLAGATNTDDDDLLASWTYDSSKQELISWDSMHTMQAKANKAVSTGLGGLMWWETSADRTGGDSAISAQVAILSAAGGMEQRNNVLSYPESQYDNLKACFPSS
ncbi:hypothetical protein FH972_024343 [Carpinus fangiana]|uniref:chitinase n=1 Tax=Carpinus fangiana TaxID=176857 RepID=A0A5N6KXS9_9ROSI|nr:hypothetical protein FH972_024343 [Carpinus fangiana]